MSYKDKYQEWLKLPFDDATIEETKSLLNNEDELVHLRY